MDGTQSERSKKTKSVTKGAMKVAPSFGIMEIIVNNEYEEICSIPADRESPSTIPEGATHFELEIDTSGCYYHGDSPDYIIHFYKKK